MGNFKVKDEFRSNKLSLIPGGSIVKVLDGNGNLMEYDKIKNPIAYINKILRLDSTIKAVYINGELYWN